MKTRSCFLTYWERRSLNSVAPSATLSTLFCIMANVIGRGIKKGLQGIGGNSTGLGEVYDENERGCLQSTFAPYYIVTIALNSVAVLAGCMSQFDFHYNQRNTRFDRLDTWYTANAVFGVMHILAAIYIVYKIEKPNSSTSATNSRAIVDVENRKAFDYSQLQGAANHSRPPPQNPNYIQPHEVAIVPTHRSPRAAAAFPHAPPRLPPKTITEPATWPRIKYGKNIIVRVKKKGYLLVFSKLHSLFQCHLTESVLTEDKIVAIYILVFAVYLSWHYFMDFSYISYHYRYNHGIQFVMKCADIFIWAGPASLLFSIGMTMAKRD